MERTKRTGVRMEANIFDEMKAYCALKDIGFGRYIADAAIKQFKNDTAQGVQDEKQQTQKSKRHV